MVRAARSLAAGQLAVGRRGCTRAFVDGARDLATSKPVAEPRARGHPPLCATLYGRLRPLRVDSAS
jgi:hypothetical protein